MTKINKLHTVTIICLVLSMILISGCGSGKSSNKSTEKNYETTIKITAIDLYNQYQANEVNADQKFKNAIIEVSGTIGTIEKGIGSELILRFDTNNYLNSVWSYFPEKAEGQLSKLKKGQKIVVRAKVQGMVMGNVMLNDSIIWPNGQTDYNTPPLNNNAQNSNANQSRVQNQNNSSNTNADWRYIVTEGNTSFSIDMNSVKFTPDKRMVYVMLTENQSDAFMLSLVNVDAPSKQYRIEKSQLIDKKTMNIIEEYPAGEWDSMDKGSPADKILNYIFIHYPETKDSNANTTDSKNIIPTTKYKTYTNGKYGFSIDYPADFIPQSPSADGDVREFKSPDGKCSITVAGSNTPANQALKGYSDNLNKASYKARGDNWFVVSWLTNNGDIYYQKTFFGANSSNSLYLTYPKNQKERYDDLVAHLDESFKPGNLDKGH